MAAISSRYDFRNATFPLAGSNGNPYGNFVKDSHLVINSEGALAADSYQRVYRNLAPHVTVDLSKGYFIEFKYKASAGPIGLDKIIFSMINAKGYFAIAVSRNLNAGLTLSHYSGTHQVNSTSTNIVLYDGAFHVYRIEYSSGTVKRYRDGVLITAGQAATMAAPNTEEIRDLYLIGAPNGSAGDPTAPITVEYSEFTFRSVGNDALPDQIFSKGIARGFQRGIV